MAQLKPAFGQGAFRMVGTKIGLEIHAELATESKLFCSCATSASEPNSAVCPTCCGFPGAKPVLNRKAVDFAVMVALGLNCRVNREFFFSRKSYFYPDLAKNFQTTQYEIPVGENGFIDVGGKKVRIRRVHLEEDPAALVHESGRGPSSYCLVDYNRSGVPLVEIVTEPDMGSPAEARALMDRLLVLLNYLGVHAHGKGVLKADCNISIEGGERVEVKNVTGFRAIEDALEAELARQQKLVASGEKVVLETRGFDADTKSTYSMRSKETEDDYGYITDTDLVKTEIDDAWLAALKARVPELSQAKALRFMQEYGLREYDAKVLSAGRRIAGIFEDAAKIDVQVAVRMVGRELLGVLNYNTLKIEDTKIDAKGISGLVLLIKEGKVSDKNAKESLIRYALEGVPPKEFLEKNKLLIDTHSSDVGAVAKGVVAENRQAFDDFRAGNTKSLNFLIGLVMRKMKGKADARQVQKIIGGMK